MKYLLLVLAVIFNGALVGAVLFGDSALLGRRIRSVGPPAVATAAFYLYVRRKERRASPTRAGNGPRDPDGDLGSR